MALNFPNGFKVSTKKNLTKANLGMNLETMIIDSNEFYLMKQRAVIHKKPTPVQIVKVDYPARNKAVITEAYYKTPSTTDFNGIYRGKYIDFEAKENRNVTLFPLANVHSHQIEHLKQITSHGGIGFLIVSWSKYNEFYLLPLPVFLKYWENQDKRKSIPYQVFKEEAHLIQEGYQPRLDYLRVVDEIYF